MVTDSRELLLLLHNSPMYFNQLLELSGVSKNYLIGRLDYLIKKGYIIREGTRGQYLYKLTEEGLKEATRYRILKHVDKMLNNVLKEVDRYESRGESIKN